MTKRLRRSTTDTWAFGVCGGIAEYFDVAPTLVRVGYLFLTFFSACFPGVLLYFVLAIVMPKH